MIKIIDCYRQTDNKIIGNKATNILKMKENGANVPSTWIFENTYVIDMLKNINLYNEGIEIDNFEKVRDVFQDKDFYIEFGKKISDDLNQIEIFDLKQRFAIRSSSSLEDSSAYSFAGMFTTILNVNHHSNMVNAVYKVILDGFSEQIEMLCRKYEITKIEPCSVIIQKLIDSKIGGVSFREDEYVTCSTTIGLTKGIADGVSDTDTWIFDNKGIQKKVIEQKRTCVLPVFSRTDPLLGEKFIKKYDNVVCHFKCIKTNFESGIVISEVPENLQTSQMIDDVDMEKVMRQINEIADKLSMDNYDSEWCIDNNNVLYLLQIRNITKSLNSLNLHFKSQSIPIVSGKAVGKVCIVKNKRDLGDFQNGDILVTNIINGDAIYAALNATACIIETSSMLSHSAIIAREMGLPCIGINNIDEISNGSYVEIDGDAGTYSIIDKINEKVETSSTNTDEKYEYKIDGIMESQLLYVPIEWRKK